MRSAQQGDMQRSPQGTTAVLGNGAVSEVAGDTGSRQLTIGKAGASLTLTLDARRAAQVRQSVPFRRVVRPLWAALRHRSQPSDHSSPVGMPQQRPSSDRDQLPQGANDTAETRALWQRVCDQPHWYHSIDLGNGIVTPGAFDHRPILDRYHLPASFAGKRALDVATWDGFWAFEMERRGASEVVALDLERYSDLDLPPQEKEALLRGGNDGLFGAGFAIAKQARHSHVVRRELSVYDLAPERVGGSFDFVFCSDLLLHLMNVPKALQAIRSVTRGEAIFVDVFDPQLDSAFPYPVTQYLGGHTLCIWWFPSQSCLLQMIRDAGFQHVELLDTLRLGEPGREPDWHAIVRARP